MNGRISRFFFCFIRKVLFPTIILLVLSVSAEADIDYIPRYHICIKKLNAEVILDNTFARITGEYSLGYSVKDFIYAGLF